MTRNFEKTNLATRMTKEEVQEVINFKAQDHSGPTLKCTYNEIDCPNATTLPIIIAKPGWSWGASSGANSKGVAAAVIWHNEYAGLTADDSSNSLVPLDFVRLCLEQSQSSEEGVEVISKYLEAHGPSETKYQASYIICDCEKVWLLNTAGKLWAAQLLPNGLSKISPGLSVKTIDKCSGSNKDELGDFWPSKGSNFSTEVVSSTFSISELFSVLRDKENNAFHDQENVQPTQNSHVSSLSQNRLNCHWFTATPDPSISVFKPFIFTPNAVVSPLTVCKKQNDGTYMHGLYKLHSVGATDRAIELLKDIEACCVGEVQLYLETDSNVNPELDELMKDCVEAEVKFYR
ncbi:secernin-2-like [Ctenocephalides felis]|uniref:secernin-2-like n=1 Tax=Ctenocephalides felis TaxID=7515 RepID=UPI000E6E58B8|nr:secernin-2-like [Ctenocephalides felis]